VGVLSSLQSSDASANNRQRAAGKSYRRIPTTSDLVANHARAERIQPYGFILDTRGDDGLNTVEFPDRAWFPFKAQWRQADRRVASDESQIQIIPCQSDFKRPGGKKVPVRILNAQELTVVGEDVSGRSQPAGEVSAKKGRSASFITLTAADCNVLSRGRSRLPPSLR
jgi:hypothetical protein